MLDHLPLLDSFDWGAIAAAFVVAAPGYVAAFFGFWNHHRLKVPSGGTIGEVTERTHAISAADLALTKHVARQVTSGEPMPPEVDVPAGDER
jgi:hypothetical protein